MKSRTYLTPHGRKRHCQQNAFLHFCLKISPESWIDVGVLPNCRDEFFLALPEGFGSDEASARRGIDDLVAALRDDTSLQDQAHVLASRMAASAAACDPGSLHTDQAQLLVDKLFACREPNLTPDGRRCLTILTLEELEKKI